MLQRSIEKAHYHKTCLKICCCLDKSFLIKFCVMSSLINPNFLAQIPTYDLYNDHTTCAEKLTYCVYDRQWERESEETCTNEIISAISDLYKQGQREITVKISDSVKAILHAYTKRGSAYDSRVFGYLQKRIGERVPELKLCQIRFEIDVPIDVSDRDVCEGGDEKCAYSFMGISHREGVDYNVMKIKW